MYWIHMSETGAECTSSVFTVCMYSGIQLLSMWHRHSSLVHSFYIVLLHVLE